MVSQFVVMVYSFFLDGILDEHELCQVDVPLLLSLRIPDTVINVIN
jgi:hypothetical protein